MDYGKCIGLEHCMIACRYQFSYYDEQIGSYFKAGLTDYEKLLPSIPRDIVKTVEYALIVPLGLLPKWLRSQKKCHVWHRQFLWLHEQKLQLALARRVPSP